MSPLSEKSPGYARETKGPTVLAVCCTLTVLATLFVAGRLYVRTKILARVGLDDWLILLSMICGYVMLGLTIAAVKSGNGRHFSTLTTEQKQGAILFTFSGFVPGIFSFGIPKLAVVALLTKITNPSRKHRIFLWAMTSSCLFILFGCVIIIFAQCNPSRSQWDFSVEGTCWSPWVLIDYAIVAGTISAAVDLYLAVYPAVILYGLKINLKTKLALSVALGLGSIATGVAIYKSTRLPALASPDFSYDAADITVWTSIEGNSIIIAACIPTLQPLFELVLGRRILDSTRSRNKYKNYKPSVNSGGKLELATIGSKGTRHLKKMGASETALRPDSQDSILRSHTRLSGEESNGTAHEPGIRRTHDVTVVYGEQQGTGQEVEKRVSSERW